jgi:hypothetical protein
MRVVGRLVDREAAGGTMLEALVDRQDDQLAGAAEPALHHDAGQIGLHAGLSDSYLDKISLTTGVKLIGLLLVLIC